MTVEFPVSEEMSKAARQIHNAMYNHEEFIISNPDRKLIEWTDMEYALFKALERDRYGAVIEKGFSTVDDFVSMANRVLNRRKSRAGKSLENHLSALFDGNGIIYTAQAVTEGNKKPDFIFPSEAAYHDINYDIDKIVSLAAKTTCKDRWRQVLNEADRLRDKIKVSLHAATGAFRQCKWMKCRQKMLFWSYRNRIYFLIRRIDGTEYGLLQNSFNTLKQ